MSVRESTIAPISAASSSTDSASKGSTHVRKMLAPSGSAPPAPGAKDAAASGTAAGATRTRRDQEGAR